MSFSRYIPFEGCGGPERTKSLWGAAGFYCLLLPAVVRSVADGGATRVVTTIWADLAIASDLAFLALGEPVGSSGFTSVFTFVYFCPIAIHTCPSLSPQNDGQCLGGALV